MGAPYRAGCLSGCPGREGSLSARDASGKGATSPYHMSMESVFSLDREALAKALDEHLDEFSLDSHDEWQLDCFGDREAVRDLVDHAFDEWGCLKQRDGLTYEIAVSQWSSETEDNLIVSVRHSKNYGIQLSSLTKDANRMADDQFGSGMNVLAEVLESVIEDANAVLEKASTFPLPEGD